MIRRIGGQWACLDVSEFSSILPRCVILWVARGRDHILAEVLFMTFVVVLTGNNNAGTVIEQHLCADKTPVGVPLLRFYASALER